MDKERCFPCWPLPGAIIVEIFDNFKQYYVTYTIINFGILVGNVQTSVLAMMLKLAGPCCHRAGCMGEKQMGQMGYGRSPMGPTLVL